MSFSLHLIDNPIGADELLSDLRHERRTLVHRKESLDLRAENAAENVAETSAEITRTEQDLTAVKAKIATMADGPDKETEITKEMELTLRLRKLRSSGPKTNGVAVLMQELEADLLNRQVEGINNFETLVEQRKKEF